jgi:hypothetical protein
MSGVWKVVRRLVTAELRLYRTVGPWLLRRTDAPAGATPFSYAVVLRPVLWTFIGVSAVEVVAFHLLIPWPGVRLALDILGVWGLFWMVSLTASLSTRPHLLTDDGLRIRYGVGPEVTVPWEFVRSATERRRSREKSRAVQLDRDPAGSVLNVVVSSQTTVDLALCRPLDVDLPAGRESVVAIRLHADDARGLVRAVRERIGREDRVVRPAE